MITGLHHVAISTADFDKTKAFYSEHFGLEPVFELEFEEGRFIASEHREADAEPLVNMITGLEGCSGRQGMFRIGNAHLELFEWKTPVPRKHDPNWRVFDNCISHICFQVDDIESWYQRLKSADIEFLSSPQEFEPVKNVYARDPEGNVIELIEPKAEGHELDIRQSPLANLYSIGQRDNSRPVGLHHTGISVVNYQRSKDFYLNQLGMELVFEMDFSDGRFDTLWETKGSAGNAAMFRLGNAFFEFFEFDTPRPEPRNSQWQVCDHGITHFCLEVDDLDRLYQRLKAEGVSFTSPPLSFGDVKGTYALDPDGNMIELFEALENGKGLSITQQYSRTINDGEAR